MMQDIDCQKCGCSNRLGTVFCKNCGTKLKFSKQLLDTQKGKKVKKTVKRAVKAVIILAIIVVIGMAFCPWGFPEVKKVTDKEEITAIIGTCQEIDDALAKESSKASYEFTAPEATFAANYLSLEHEKKTKTASAPMTFDSKGLGSTGKMGGASMTGPGSLKSAGGDDAPPAPKYTDPEMERRRAWMKRKQEARKNAGKPELSPNFDFIITIKDDKTLCIVLKEVWLKIIPARLEVCIVPNLIVNAKERTQVLEYNISSARFGHLPVPLYFKDYILDLFEEMLMQEREWAKRYFKRIKNVEIANQYIKVTVGK
jgi:hypothetical protein